MFAFVAKHRGIWPVGRLCAALGASRSAFLRLAEAAAKRAGEPNWDQNGSLEVTRFETSVLPGKSGRYQGSVEFSCAADDQSMQIEQRDRFVGSDAR